MKQCNTMEERIKRINELYHKSQDEGLTEEERAEQAVLRRDYVAGIRNNLRNQLDSIDIQNEDGSIENLGEKFGKKDGSEPTEEKGTSQADS